MQKQDVIIVGSGPAGITAALYAVRAGLKTLVVGENQGALRKASRIENYYGFESPLTGSDLLEKGIAQARRLGAELLEQQVIHIGYEDAFIVQADLTAWQADAVVLATGANRATPPIEGLAAYEGKGVSYCAVCDAFFYKGKEVAVLGCCEYALHEAMELLPIAKSVTIITNGVPSIANIPKEIKVIETGIQALTGKETLEQVRFKDGASLAVAGVFVAMGVAGSIDLARKLGAETDAQRVVVNDAMETNVPGLFAAGDCTGGMMQIAKAVYEGAKAGTEAVKYIRSQR